MNQDEIANPSRLQPSIPIQKSARRRLLQTPATAKIPRARIDVHNWFYKVLNGFEERSIKAGRDSVEDPGGQGFRDEAVGAVRGVAAEVVQLEAVRGLPPGPRACRRSAVPSPWPAGTGRWHVAGVPARRVSRPLPRTPRWFRRSRRTAGMPQPRGRAPRGRPRRGGPA